MRHFILTVLALPLIAAAPVAKPQPLPLTGNWAGDGFALRTVGTGYVVQGKCASGKITSQVVPDAAGAFAASGYYNVYTSGYRVSDLSRRDTPASFKGKVSGNTLNLTMRVKGRPEDVQVVLKRGAKIKFPACD